MSAYLRERLEQAGPRALSTTELLSLFFPGRPLSPGDLEHLGTFLEQDPSLLQNNWAEVSIQCHLTPARCAQMQALFELARRFQSPPPEKYRIKTPEDAARLVMPDMAYLDHEELRILVLNTRLQVVENRVLYQGTVNSSVLRSAEIFRLAVTRNCPNVIVCHNHPSGDSSPSPEDIQVTEQLVAASRILDIDLIDHLVIGCHRFVSLKERMRW